MTLLLFAMSCQDESPEPTPDVRIDGKAFYASSIRLENDGEGLILHFQGEQEHIEIHTYDSLPGRFLFQEAPFKAAVKPARLIYRKGSKAYLGTSGKLDLEYKDGLFSGVFESATQSLDSIRVLLTEGVFQDLESRKVTP